MGEAKYVGILSPSFLYLELISLSGSDEIIGVLML